MILNKVKLSVCADCCAECSLLSAQITVAHYYISIPRKALSVSVCIDALFYLVRWGEGICIDFSIFKLVLQCLCVLINMYDVQRAISIAL